MLRNTMRSKEAKASFQKGRMIVGIAFVLSFMIERAHAQEASFSALAGSWTGNGSISLADGSKERLRCRAAYQVSGDGTTLRQTLRCASDSYKFELSSNIVSDEGQLSGSWSEASHGIGGSLRGNAKGNRVTATVYAPGFNAWLAVTTVGNRQSVSISSQGEIRNVSVSMTKS